jgi:hypothetical protein
MVTIKGTKRLSSPSKGFVENKEPITGGKMKLEIQNIRFPAVRPA